MVFVQDSGLEAHPSVKLMHMNGELVQVKYPQASAFLESGHYGILPLKEQAEGFDIKMLEHFLNGQSYPVWKKYSWLMRIMPYSMAPKSKYRMTRRQNSARLPINESNIFLRPLILGFSLKEILSFAVGAFVSWLFSSKH